MTTADVLARFPGARRSGAGWQARCPAHDDKVASLAIKEGADGKVLVKCHAGCTSGAVVAAVGLAMRDLFPDDAPRRNGNGKQESAVYNYTTESGKNLYQVVRYQPKDFRPRRPDGNGGWIYNLDDIERVPYCLPDLLGAIRRGKTICFTEGEKDTESLRSLGLHATTTGSATSWKQHHAKWFAGAKVVILPDNDDPGEQFARAVAHDLMAVAERVAIVRLPGLPPHGDVSDWLALGGDKAQLAELVRSTSALTRETLDALSHAPGAAGEQPKPRARRALSRRLSDVHPERVDWLSPGRIPFGKLTVVEGDPGVSKSTLLLDLAARITRGEGFPGDPRLAEPAAVIVLSAEDGLADTIRPRLEAASADCTRVHALEGFVADNGTTEEITLGDPNHPESLEALEGLIREHGARLVVVDVFTAYLSGARDAHRDHDIRRALRPIAALAERTGCAIVVVRHLRKSAGGNAISAGGGSVAIGGAARSVLLVGKDPEDDDRRVLASVKSNLAAPPPSLSYRLETDERLGASRIVWLGASQQTAETLTEARAGEEREPGQRSKVEECAECLREWLAGGPMDRKDALRLGRDRGFSDSTVERAARKIGVVHKGSGFGEARRSDWSLPPFPSGNPIPVSISGLTELTGMEAVDGNGAPKGLSDPSEGDAWEPPAAPLPSHPEDPKLVAALLDRVQGRPDLNQSQILATVPYHRQLEATPILARLLADRQPMGTV